MGKKLSSKRYAKNEYSFFFLIFNINPYIMTFKKIIFIYLFIIIYSYNRMLTSKYDKTMQLAILL